MNTHARLHPVRRTLAVLSLLTLLPVVVRAGHPLICHPYAIGDARTLPGGTWKGADPTYDRTHLVRDTLALLTPETPVLVRMETLRRAAIYATANMRGWDKGTAYTLDDREIAKELLEKLRERSAATMESEAARAIALFDLGFFSETLRQTKLDPALDGYALMLKAVELRGYDPVMEFALALASAHPKRREHGVHLAQARAGAQSGTLLAANLASHFQ